jgi:hypothetical protein
MFFEDQLFMNDLAVFTALRLWLMTLSTASCPMRS